MSKTKLLNESADGFLTPWVEKKPSDHSELYAVLPDLIKDYIDRQAKQMRRDLKRSCCGDKLTAAIAYAATAFGRELNPKSVDF